MSVGSAAVLSRSGSSSAPTPRSSGCCKMKSGRGLRLWSASVPRKSSSCRTNTCIWNSTISRCSKDCGSRATRHMQSFSQSVGADSSAKVADPSSVQPMTRPVLESWLRLRAIDGVGDLTVLRLVRAWHSPEAVLHASRDELIQSGCSPQLADAIRRGPDRSACRSIERELKAIERERIEVRSAVGSCVSRAAEDDCGPSSALVHHRHID